MTERHVHRFTTEERRKKGLAGMLGRTEFVFACACGMTAEEFTNQLTLDLADVEQRLAGFDHGDGEICEDEHPVQRRSLGFGGAPPGSMPPGM